MKSYFKELLQIFNAEKVEYLVVGAHAVIHYTEPRFTKDHDAWVNPTEENARKVYQSLALFGVPLSDAKWEHFSEKGNVYQIGTTTERIDIITEVSGLDFLKCWKRKLDFNYDGIPIHIIGRQDLIANKRIVGRGQDLLDLEKLERLSDEP